MIHQLKIEEQYFQAKLDGLKPFEIRKRDRDFRVGDFLALNEVALTDIGAGVATGRCCLEEIVYILDDPRFVQDGCVILSTRGCIIGKGSNRFEFETRSNPLKVCCYGEQRKDDKEHG